MMGQMPISAVGCRRGREELGFPIYPSSQMGLFCGLFDWLWVMRGSLVDLRSWFSHDVKSVLISSTNCYFKSLLQFLSDDSDDCKYLMLQANKDKFATWKFERKCSFNLDLSILMPISTFCRPKGPPEPASPSGRPRPRSGHCQRAF